MSLRRQCALLGLARSGVHDQPVGERAEDLQLMRLVDAPYTETPLYGVRRMTAWLRRQGDGVHPKHTRRLRRQMGLEAIYPKPRLSQPAAGHTIYPDLLRGVTIGWVHQVWSANITSIRLASGVVYLVAVIDGCSRSVLSWGVSITMAVAFCVETLEQALPQGHPAIFKMDQRAPLTSLAFTARRQQGGVRIRIEGRGRALDHVCVERLWRRVTSEEAYGRDDQSAWDARHSLARSVAFDHGERFPQALGYRTPAAISRGGARGLSLVRAKSSSEALEMNVFCPKNGLDNGEHFRPRLRSLQSAQLHNASRFRNAGFTLFSLACPQRVRFAS